MCNVRQRPNSTKFLFHSWWHHTWRYRESGFSLSNSVSHNHLQKNLITKLQGTEKLLLYMQSLLYQGSKNNKIQKKLVWMERKLLYKRVFLISDFIKKVLLYLLIYLIQVGKILYICITVPCVLDDEVF